MLKFNTSWSHQIEIKIRFQCRCTALAQLRPSHFYLLALQSQSLYHAFWLRLHHNFMQIARWFDANCSEFQRNFISSFVFSFTIIWLSINYKLPNFSTYLERERVPSWIYHILQYQLNCNLPHLKPHSKTVLHLTSCKSSCIYFITKHYFLFYLFSIRYIFVSKLNLFINQHILQNKINSI